MFTPWIQLTVLICNTCGAVVMDHMDLKANHAAWHERIDGRDDAS